jgi:Mn-containing catalase
VKEALGFLMTREIAHQKSFEKALYSIQPNFPAGKMPGDPRFANTYFNMSQGPGEMRGSWNQGENWDFVTDREKQMAVDGGTGEAEVRLPSKDVDVLKQMAERTMSDPNVDPPTGAELGMGNQTLADGMTVQPGAQPSPGAPKLH